jgi:hypothetical protein
MNFADHLLKLLKRIATIDVAHASTDINDDGVLELEVIAILDKQIAPICSITENATQIEITQFELQLDLLENALVAQSREDAENSAKAYRASAAGRQSHGRTQRSGLLRIPVKEGPKGPFLLGLKKC